jgi:hypothetical protein
VTARLGRYLEGSTHHILLLNSGRYGERGSEMRAQPRSDRPNLVTSGSPDDLPDFCELTSA